MNTSDLALISVVSVLAFGFMTISIGLFGIWIGMRNELRESKSELRDMRAELMSEIRDVGVRIDAVSVRVSDAELENARMQGAMSVIQAQSHSHDAPPSAGD